MGRMSRIRQKAAREDVRNRVYWAGFCGDFSNPYPESERRHEWFKAELLRYHRLDAEVVDLYEAYGTPLPKLREREHPGEVLSEDELARIFLEKQEQERQLAWDLDSDFDD